jgi:hypothetical protein
MWVSSDLDFGGPLHAEGMKSQRPVLDREFVDVFFVLAIVNRALGELQSL